MSASFDPYHKWLGIPADEQPPSLYRLLGVQPFESDPDVIDTATDQRIRLLKSFQGGKNGSLSQKLLNEVSRARQRLLDAKERAAYDAQLREHLKKQGAASGGSSAQRKAKWPEGKAPSSLDEFYQCVTASGILSADEVRQLHDSLPTEKKPKDPKALATELVRAHKLTKYQAISLLQGKLRYLSFGEYVILEKLGQGGMGQVMKAEHRRMKRLVALKLVTGEALKNPDAIRRFQREVHAAARLIHPNIVTAFDANEHEGVHFFVMEFVEGLDLGALSKLHGPLPVAMAADYILQAARGLAYAHGKGIVHRDIKPGNLLVDRDGTVKILDMGLARIDRDEARELTGSGQVLGTVDYMAPEQALDTHAADARADIYSLGCTLYRLLAAEVIYADDNMMRTLLSHREAPIPALKTKRPDVPAAIEAIYQKMVAKRPEDRQQTMAEVVAQLESVVRPSSASAHPAATPSAAGDLKLHEFLSGMATRDSGRSVSGSSASGFSAVSVATDSRTVVASRFSEITKDLTSGETDPNTLAKMRSDAKPKAGAGETLSERSTEASRNALTYVAIACATAAVLVLLIGGVALLSRRTTGNNSARAETTADAVLPPAKLDTPDTPDGPPLAEVPFSAEDARQHQTAWATHLNQPVEITNRIGMKLVLIPPGKFMQGSSAKQMDAAVEHLPFAAQPLIKSEAQREVTIDQPFWLSVHEVTVREFRQFVQAMQYVTTAERDGKGAERFNPETKITEQRPEFTWKHAEFVSETRLPVVGVSLEDAQAFCRWLSRTHERTYFISTEAQWEYACRAGTNTIWYWGDDPLQSDKFAWSSGRNAVGGKRPNAFGLFDMLGNAAEITLAQDNSAIARGASPSGQTPWFSRSAGREPRGTANFWTGFRVAMGHDAGSRPADNASK